MMPGMEPSKPGMCRFRGEEMALADAQMMLTKEELDEVEVTQADGSVVRPFRFCEVDPEIRFTKDGIPKL
jgi:hypothetical protein